MSARLFRCCKKKRESDLLAEDLEYSSGESDHELGDQFADLNFNDQLKQI